MRCLKILVLTAALALTARAADRTIYPAPQQSRADLVKALKAAPAEHKRILLDFGGNWCGDCQVLDIYMHNPQNLPILDRNFLLVHVNVGQYDANLDLAKRYGVPLKKGVPALVVLSENGKVLYAQRQGEFEAMRRMDPTSVTRFLVQWRPERPGCSVMRTNC